MQSANTRQALADDVKREVLMELNLGGFQRRGLVENIKREVLMDLGCYGYGQFHRPNRAFVEAIKCEILAGLRREMGQHPGVYGNEYYPDRTVVDSIKQEVIAQIEAEQENQEKSHRKEQKNTSEQHYGTVDPASCSGSKE